MSIETWTVRVTKIGIIFSCIIDSLPICIAGETISAIETSQASKMASVTDLARIIIIITSNTYT